MSNEGAGKKYTRVWEKGKENLNQRKANRWATAALASVKWKSILETLSKQGKKGIKVPVKLCTHKSLCTANVGGGAQAVMAGTLVKCFHWRLLPPSLASVCMHEYNFVCTFLHRTLHFKSAFVLFYFFQLLWKFRTQDVEHLRTKKRLHGTGIHTHMCTKE